MRLLQRWDSEALGELDAMIVDCAAQVLQLGVRCIRADREVESTLGVDVPPASASAMAFQAAGDERRRRLLLERRRLVAERNRIEALMGSLRMHRDRIAAGTAGRP